MAVIDERSGGDELFARLQRVLPQHWLSRGMHALARSRQPCGPQRADPHGAALVPADRHARGAAARPVRLRIVQRFLHARAATGRATDRRRTPTRAVSPVDGTVSQLGRTDAGRLIQAKGMDYTCDALLADTASAARYAGGSFACLYLAPYNYHRIHMPLDGVLRATRYVPGHLFSVNASTARTVPELFARNERVVCDFDTDHGPMCLVLVGALFVGSIETVFAGEINPPPGRGGQARVIEAGVGATFRARRGNRPLQHGLDRDRAVRQAGGLLPRVSTGRSPCAWASRWRGSPHDDDAAATCRSRDWRPTATLPTLRAARRDCSRACANTLPTPAPRGRDARAGARTGHRRAPRVPARRRRRDRR